MPTVTVDEETWKVLLELSREYKLPMGLIIKVLLGLEPKLNSLREQIIKDAQKYAKRD